MNAEYVFLEYTHNGGPDYTNLESSFSRLGFTKRSQHPAHQISMWIQNLFIVMLREDTESSHTGISGMGFIVDDQFAEQCVTEYDSYYDLYYLVDPNGIKNYLISKSMSGMISDFEDLDTSVKSTPEINYVSGLVYNDYSQALVDHYAQLFGKQQHTEKYHTFTTKNNRFNLIFNKSACSNKITTVICETKNIFHSAGYFSVRDYDLKQYSVDLNNMDFDRGTMNKILGYGCAVFGSNKSHSIETMIHDKVLDLTLILRMREKFLNIPEESLEAHNVG